MLKIVCPVVSSVNTDGECLISVETLYARIEKVCPSKQDAMVYLKELSHNYQIKGYVITMR